MRILLTGGGTAGSVTPLLAIVEEIKRKNSQARFLFIGTRKGVPERKLVLSYGIPYKGIHSGKLRRYFDWRNFFDPILLFLGVIESFFIINKFKPNIILSAGSFVSVPVVWAGWFLKIPILIHQQDVVPGLANLIMAPFATKITLTFQKSMNSFPKKKTVLTGNPVRPEILSGSKERIIKELNLERNLPTLLVIGGGTGAQKINELIWQILPELTKFCQVIHLTGQGKLRVQNYKLQTKSRYHPYEFLTKEIADVYALADLVVSRAGMGVLTELIALGKPAILIPIPNSHQEKNAELLAEKKAVYVLWQNYLTPDMLFKKIRELILNQEELTKLGQHIKQFYNPLASQKIVEEIEKICYK